MWSFEISKSPPIVAHACQRNVPRMRSRLLAPSLLLLLALLLFCWWNDLLPGGHKSLRVFAAAVCIISLLPYLTSAKQLALATAAGLAGGTVMCAAIAFLLGAPADHLQEETLLWALIHAALTCVPLVATLDTGSNWAASLASSLMAWSSAAVIPMDWDRPWQAWPLPCVWGSVAGYLVGSVLAAGGKASEQERPP